jgi:hypothetical protein
LYALTRTSLTIISIVLAMLLNLANVKFFLILYTIISSRPKYILI